MGSGVEDYPKKHTHQPNSKYMLMLALVVITNILTIYICTGPSFKLKQSPVGTTTNDFSVPPWDINTLLLELNSTREQLDSGNSLIADLHQKLNSTNLLVKALLGEQSSRPEALPEKKASEPMKLINAIKIGNAMSDEETLAVGHHKLPHGYLPRMGSDEVYPSVGAGCLRNQEELEQYMTYDAPFNSFIAARGLIPIRATISQRLPFFENTLDIVHSMHVLSNWIPDAMLEFTLYDIYRVLRPGGLFWLDHFFCLGSQLNQTYVPMLDRVGFNKLRWNAGMKLDRGIDKNEWYSWRNQ